MKPILFNTQMVQAILEGRKTTTRRIVKDIDNNYTYLGSDKQKTTVSFSRKTTGLPLKIKIPYQVGDILYVRETWMIQSMKNYEKNVKFLYKARPTKLNEVHVSNKRYEEMLKFECKNGWQSSLFMPKVAARIFLKVTNVRVERLQDIDGEGAKAEGIRKLSTGLYGVNEETDIVEQCLYPKDSFIFLWKSTLKKNQLEQYGWNVNSWVWVIEFERIDKSEVSSNEI